MIGMLLEAAPAQGGFEQYSGILMMVLIFVVFYFFMIRPQQKKQKEIKKFQESLQPGKSVVTSGGIYGKIKEVKDEAVIIEIADNVKIKVHKNMVFDSPDNVAQ